MRMPLEPWVSVRQTGDGVEGCGGVQLRALFLVPKGLNSVATY